MTNQTYYDYNDYHTQEDNLIDWVGDLQKSIYKTGSIKDFHEYIGNLYDDENLIDLLEGVKYSIYKTGNIKHIEEYLDILCDEVGAKREHKGVYPKILSTVDKIFEIVDTTTLEYRQRVANEVIGCIMKGWEYGGFGTCECAAAALPILTRAMFDMAPSVKAAQQMLRECFKKSWDDRDTEKYNIVPYVMQNDHEDSRERGKDDILQLLDMWENDFEDISVWEAISSTIQVLIHTLVEAAHTPSKAHRSILALFQDYWGYSNDKVGA